MAPATCKGYPIPLLSMSHKKKKRNIEILNLNLEALSSEWLVAAAVSIVSSERTPGMTRRMVSARSASGSLSDQHR